MTTINTVLGSADSDALGKTLIHEHLLVGFPGWFLDARQPAYNRRDAMVRVIAAFDEIKAFGVETIVDPCPSDLGRDVEFAAEVSQKTGINIVCAAGLYYENAGIPFMIRNLEVQEITDIFVKEIEDGVGSTGIRPGLLKIATGKGVVSEYERKVLTAAARAAKATGVPVLSHTEKCTCGHDQIDIVTGEGVDPAHFLVGHSDGTDDLEYQESLAKRGVYVGFDRFGLEGDATDEIRMRNLKALVDRGYREQLMMSHDYVNCFLGGVPGLPVGTSLNDVMPNWRMNHIFERIIPVLKDRGMTDEDFDVILRDNPGRFFSVFSD
jgi:phosphotriesterase-related protein